MNKVNNNKLRKFLILLVVLSLIATVVIILMKLFWDTSGKKIYQCPYTARSWDQYECLKKGNVCSEEDIKKAIKVKIPVNEKETYNFYLIDNNEEYAILLMDENLGGIVDWALDDNNQKGPTNALYAVLERTKNWTFVPIIESYEYLDYGKSYFEMICKDENKDLRDSSYDCSKDLLRGYGGISITNGRTILRFNEEDYTEDSEYDFNATELYKNARARLITFEEIDKFFSVEGYPDWFIDNTMENEGYWTLSSSPFESTLYTTATLGMTNYLNKPFIRELYPVNQHNDLNKRNGLRPVITMLKY